MNFQIFPNWCKKLGVFMFILFSILGSYDDMVNGFIDGANNTFERGVNNIAKYNLFSLKAFLGEKLTFFFMALSLVGMLIYMLSKEKVEDDYINKLRLQSYQLSFILVISFLLLFYCINFKIDIDIESIITILLAIYLIIFAIKKRTI